MSRLLRLVRGFRRGFSGPARNGERLRKKVNVSIGIFVGTTPFDLADARHIDNPVLSAADVKDVPALIVADPFMWRSGDRWHMFFEVFNSDSEKGEIGLATSGDGFEWHYEGIVLRERHHLSYPYVFGWQEHIYMIPESRQTNAVPIYEATSFPREWRYVATLVDHSPCADSTVFHFEDDWWMFTETSDGTHDRLSLYHAERLLGPWTEHVQSPLIVGDASTARSGGRVTVYDGRLFRFAQDCRVVYGQQVRAFEVIEITRDRYEEREIDESPILKPGELGWNARGMHHVDPHEVGPNEWLACVDGFSETTTVT